MARQPAAFDDSSISPFVRKCVNEVALPDGALLLDLPCGYGRHALWLAQREYRVVAADLDEQRVSEVQSEQTLKLRLARMDYLVADCEFELPFQPTTFDMVLVVHYYSDLIIERVSDVIKPGGHLIFETFGAQGQNWKSLPKSGVVATTLKPMFETVHLDERMTGPRGDRAVVRLLARRL